MRYLTFASVGRRLATFERIGRKLATGPLFVRRNDLDNPCESTHALSLVESFQNVRPTVQESIVL
jgi:hypothetical protein